MDYLDEALRSVLEQAPGREQMQIEIVDDCSLGGPPLELVRRVAGNRVMVHAHPKNIGLAGTWNTCIERARGKWVHILHQDDLVLPGFYRRLEQGMIGQPQIGAAYCRHVLVDSDGHWITISPLERRTPGILENFIELLAERQPIQCPSIVVKRMAYEQVGGVSEELKYVLDWDMWLRIGTNFQVWYDPAICACYRIHGGSETSRLARSGLDLQETSQMLLKASLHVGEPQRRRIAEKARQHYALRAVAAGESFLCQRDFAAARHQLWGALRMSPTLPVLSAILRVTRNAAFAEPQKTSRLAPLRASRATSPGSAHQ